MSNVRGWIVGIVVGLCILGLVFFVRPARQNQRGSGSPAAKATEAVQVAANVQGTAALAGTEWQLESMGTVPASKTNIPTLGYIGGKYYGFGGCDWFSGVWDASGNQLRMQTPAKTMAGCATDPAFAQQQSMYMGSLWNVTNYEIKDGKLNLFTTGNQKLMTMTGLQPVPFEGTTWDLSLIFESNGAYWAPLIPGTRITAKFDGKTMTGSAGCNEYSAPYTRQDKTFTLGTLTVTGNTCAAPAGIMDQQAAYLKLLETIGRVEQAPRSIQLSDRSGTPALMYHAFVPPAQ